jgi:hypothetical protein
MDKLKFLLQIKTWKLFSIFILVLLFSWSETFESFLAPFIVLLWFFWVISIGYNGQDFLNGITINWLTKSKFIKRVGILLLVVILELFMPDQNNNYTNSFLLITNIIIAFVGLYCLYYVFVSTAVVVATIEYRQKAEFWSSFGHFLRLLVFPLGVVGIQPILNKEFEKLY